MEERMIRASVVLFLLGILLLWMGVSAGAGAGDDDEVFRCRDVNGTLFLTDDRDNFPPGCREEPKGYSRGGLIILPEFLLPAERDIFRREEMRPHIWKAAATALAQAYRESQNQIVTEGTAGNMRHLQDQKTQLLRAVSEENAMSGQERAEIEETLAVIPAR
jgi:hypothetical protein